MSFSRAGSKRTQWVHRLVLLAFVGEGPAGTEVLHRNGDPADNRLHNLAWGTRSDNNRDQVRHRTHAEAAKTHCPQGHPYDDENTLRESRRVHRICRTCRRASRTSPRERTP